MMKDIYSSSVRNGLYSFRTGWFQGFQMGNPAQDNIIDIEDFDSDGRRVDLLIARRPRTSTKVPQSDISRIIWPLQLAYSPEHK